MLWRSFWPLWSAMFLDPWAGIGPRCGPKFLRCHYVYRLPATEVADVHDRPQGQVRIRVTPGCQHFGLVVRPQVWQWTFSHGEILSERSEEVNIILSASALSDQWDWLIVMWSSPNRTIRALLSLTLSHVDPSMSVPRQSAKHSQPVSSQKRRQWTWLVLQWQPGHWTIENVSVAYALIRSFIGRY